ncbi:MAG: GNAT family N-acetyltransferase [Vicinamibacterales bacterium]
MDLLPLPTARLLLRWFQPADLDAFQAYRSDPVLARYQEWEPMSVAQASSFLAAQTHRTLDTAGQWLQVAVTLRESGQVIGDLGLCLTDESEGAVEIGVTMARSAQGFGYATEALTAMTEILLNQAGVRSLVAVTDTRNIAAAALLRRVGFRHERTTATIFRGEPCQEQTFVLLKVSERAGSRPTSEAGR